MTRVFLLGLILLAITLSTNSAEAQSLGDQIDAVAAVQNRNREEAEAKQREAAHKFAAQRQAEAAAAQKREAVNTALRQKKQEEFMAQQKRDQDYQDQMRTLELQERQLQLDAEKARAARTNEYIDRDLQARDAEIDVVRSQADATRNISSGAKTYLEKSGGPPNKN